MTPLFMKTTHSDGTLNIIDINTIDSIAQYEDYTEVTFKDGNSFDSSLTVHQWMEIFQANGLCVKAPPTPMKESYFDALVDSSRANR